jgi:NADH:ubiquinone oxidoreductase subunit D
MMEIAALYDTTELKNYLLQINQILFIQESEQGKHKAFKSLLGGFNQDLSDLWIDHAISLFIKFEKYIDHLLKILNLFNSAKELLCWGHIPKSELIYLGIEGPSLRASGLNYDARKFQSIYYYPDIDFEIPLGEEGTTWDRFNIRMLEIRQSNHILIQILHNLPTGLTFTADPDFSFLENYFVDLPVLSSKKDEKNYSLQMDEFLKRYTTKMNINFFSHWENSFGHFSKVALDQKWMLHSPHFPSFNLYKKMMNDFSEKEKVLLSLSLGLNWKMIEL